eukprot:TRINITY_DN1400_c1_g1_i1.p1 TRINITY_DN1400_c1_g1~~TRINITY_DN1400_c1_g1_i1.p1  ORF type:complete len:366 (+),score=46.92 TRINITY_DN1400_c1_g1_i1:65-1162(+)
MAFTPVESGVGGMMVGLAAALAFLVDGKITGISGIAGPFLRDLPYEGSFTGGHQWKGLFLLGLILGGLANLPFNRDFAFPGVIDYHPVRYLLAGLCIGSGTRFGRGCTSGHGICGLPRFSLRSWIAVPTFMVMAGVMVAVTRHALKVDVQNPPGIAELQWPPKWEFPVAALVTSLVLAAVVFKLPDSIRTYVAPLVSGLIFGLGLGCSGMTSQAKVFDFLDLGGTWDPSLAFVMGCGLCVSFPAYFFYDTPDNKPLCGGDFERPPKFGNYTSLVIGALLFGCGWGLIGICPGPALVGLIPNLAFQSRNTAGISFALCFLAIVVSWLGADRIHQYIVQRQERYAAVSDESLTGGLKSLSPREVKGA